MSAVRRVWCPQDARDAAIAAVAVHAKGVVSGEDSHGVWLSGVIADAMPVSTVPGRTRGRHRAKPLSPIRVRDLEQEAAAMLPDLHSPHPADAPCPDCHHPQWLHNDVGCLKLFRRRWFTRSRDGSPVKQCRCQRTRGSFA